MGLLQTDVWDWNQKMQQDVVCRVLTFIIFAAQCV